VLREATGEEVDAFAAERLFDPLGMAHTRMTRDASGRSTNVFFGMQSTCPDLARFGQLFAQGGEWDGEQLLPATWMRRAVGAPSQELNAAYGLLWWLNRSGPIRAPLNPNGATTTPEVVKVGRVAPGAPGRLFAAQGLGGQVVLVDPRSDTVVVRLGVVGGGDYTFADAARVITDALVE
jgi:CubicO group peptidase (beta-lactamase class C family)